MFSKGCAKAVALSKVGGFGGLRITPQTLNSVSEGFKFTSRIAVIPERPASPGKRIVTLRYSRRITGAAVLQRKFDVADKTTGRGLM